MITNLDNADEIAIAEAIRNATANHFTSEHEIRMNLSPQRCPRAGWPNKSLSDQSVFEFLLVCCDQIKIAGIDDTLGIQFNGGSADQNGWPDTTFVERGADLRQFYQRSFKLGAPKSHGASVRV